jgi:peptidoglycan hydrolase-like protein with peptidoglycan-binding domain
LTGLTDDSATLDLGSTPQRVAISAVSRYWFGDFLLLWRPPLAQAKALGPGARGADVRWLRDSLRSVQGLPPGSSRNDFYDTELTQLVQDFQRQHRLAIDGVAGVQTQIVLDTMLNATGSPTIVGPVSGASVSFILDAHEVRATASARKDRAGRGGVAAEAEENVWATVAVGLLVINLAPLACCC